MLDFWAKLDKREDRDELAAIIKRQFGHVKNLRAGSETAMRSLEAKHEENARLRGLLDRARLWIDPDQHGTLCKMDPCDCGIDDLIEKMGRRP